jgi:hypothetical protein
VPRTAWRRSAAVLAVALVPVLSACSIGVNAGTTTQQPSGNGAFANSSSGLIALRGITIVTGLGASTKATVIGTIVNQSLTEDDVLTGVTLTDPSGATVTLAGPDAATTVPLPSGRPTSAVRIGGGGDVKVDITGLSIPASAFATVTFTFQKAGAVPVAAMTVPPTGIYAGLGPFLN